MRSRTSSEHEPWSDEAVALACSSGDPQAIAELFERYQLPVTRFLSRLINAADVEDLVQITFLQIARGKARFEGRSSVKTWLFAIATNVMRQHYRSTARKKRLLWALACVNVTTTGERLLEQVDARRNVQSVREAFDALPEKSRVAFVLCEVEGLSAREAGVALATSETAIWKRVSDARKAMLRVMEGERT
jgi:RNA polymerase sigma-70 factor (ECF subfamily)